MHLDLGATIQSDIGVNACIIPCLGILENVCDITPISVGSVEKERNLQVTKIGIYPMLIKGMFIGLSAIFTTRIWHNHQAYCCRTQIRS